MLVPEATPAFNEFTSKASDVPVLVIDKVPASTFILEFPVKLMVPLKALVPKIFLIAPVLLKPVPLMVMPSGIESEPPLISKAALELAIIVPDVVAPNAALFWACTTPTVIDVVPA